MNAKLPKVKRSYVARRFEFLRKANRNVIIRVSILMLQILSLVIVRSYFSRYKLPKFTPQENPVAAHPSQLVRVNQLKFD